MFKFGVVSRTAGLMAAAFLASVSASAMANPTDPKGAETAVAASDNGTAPAAQAKPSTQRYCIVTTITGSRLPKRTCMTREQWLAEGVDPLAKDD